MTKTTTTKPPLTRVYVVKRDGKKTLVRATHPGQAVAHTYGDLVSVANQAELIFLLEQGVKIEHAKPQQEQLA